MRYQLRQKFFSLTSQYFINDASGQQAYSIMGKFFSFGDKLTMFDAQGNEVAKINQRLLTLMPHYELHRNGEFFASITKKFTWFKNKFELDVPGPNDYLIDGSFWDYEYEFRRSGNIVAQVSKQFWTLRDTYGVDIVDGEDDVAILATIAVIDMVCHDGNSSSTFDH